MDLWGKKMERAEAILKGFKKYNTGIACKYGHLSLRYSSNGICLECSVNLKKEGSVAYQKKYYLNITKPKRKK
jgi:hypothetical protein